MGVQSVCSDKLTPRRPKMHCILRSKKRWEEIHALIKKTKTKKKPYLAQFLIMVFGVERRLLLNLSSFGKMVPSRKNMANHLYLSRPGGNSISTMGNFQPLLPEE